MSASTPNTLDPETGFTEDASATSKIAQAANDLRVAAGEKARAIANSAQHLRETAADKAHALRETAAEKAQHLRECATEQWQEGRVRAKELHGTAEDYVRQNPTKSVLIALGTGFLVGLIVRR